MNYSLNDNTTRLTLHFTPETTIPFLVVSILTTLISSVGNGLLCFTIARKAPNLNLSDALTINLALSDGLYALIAFIYIFPNSLQAMIGNIPLYPGNTFRCRLSIGLPLYFGIVNIYAIAFLSIIRYIVITKPNRFRHLSNKKSILAIYLLNWIIPLSFSLPQISGAWARFPYYAYAGICGPAIKLSLGPSYILFFIYFYCLGLSMPFQAITFSYWHIYKEFTRNRQRIRDINVRASTTVTEVTKMESIISINYINSPKKPVNKPNINKGMEKKLAKTLLLIIIIEVTSFMPMAIINFIESVNVQTTLIYQNYALTAFACSFISGACNPFIFFTRNRQLNRDLKLKFKCLNP